MGRTPSGRRRPSRGPPAAAVQVDLSGGQTGAPRECMERPRKCWRPRRGSEHRATSGGLFSLEWQLVTIGRTAGHRVVSWDGGGKGKGLPSGRAPCGRAPGRPASSSGAFQIGKWRSGEGEWGRTERQAPHLQLCLVPDPEPGPRNATALTQLCSPCAPAGFPRAGLLGQQYRSGALGPGASPRDSLSLSLPGGAVEVITVTPRAGSETKRPSARKSLCAVSGA